MNVLNFLIRKLENEWDSETNLILYLTYILYLMIKSILASLNMSLKNDNKDLNSVSNNMLNNSLTVSHMLIKVSFLTVLFYSLS